MTAAQSDTRSEHRSEAQMPTLAQAQSQLRRHGRSFYWAGHFLPRHSRYQATRLYNLCRQIDDLADNASTPQEQTRAGKQLLALQQAIIHSAPAQSPLAAQALDLCQHQPLFRQALIDLLAAVQGDLQPVQMDHWPGLLGYCYGVAGTVGVMMAQLLEVEQQPLALPHAIDLGIAMQLTNMARDVLEDAHMGRVYLPADGAAGRLSAHALARGDTQSRRQAWQGVLELLERADHYYRSGWQGLGFIPARPRLAIAIAARVYQDIGPVIRRQGPTGYWQGRARVSGPRKLLLTLASLWQVPDHTGYVQHDGQLHQDFISCLNPRPEPWYPEDVHP
ncbi:MAG: phytoene/squalene synthase family protein [Halomonadaceae bacterium]|nr:MAG: phytoene/squalene synthase family protein [Halomonadaceae bacterium]